MSIHAHRRTAVLLGCAATLLAGPAPLAAQAAERLSLDAGGGLVVPLHSMRERVLPGPQAAAAFRLGLGESGSALRAEISTSYLPARWIALQGEGAGAGHPDLRAVALSLAYMREMGDGPVRPYLLAGPSIHWMQLDDDFRNPYGAVLGASLGGGVARGAGRWRAFVEARALLILSDYGAAEFQPGVQAPLLLGIGRRLGG